MANHLLFGDREGFGALDGVVLLVIADL